MFRGSLGLGVSAGGALDSGFGWARSGGVRSVAGCGVRSVALGAGGDVRGAAFGAGAVGVACGALGAGAHAGDLWPHAAATRHESIQRSLIAR